MAEAIATTVSEFGGLHWAFNNAGVDQPTRKLHELSADDYDLQFDVKVRGVFLSIKHQVPAIIASGGGAIVNTPLPPLT